MDFIVNCAERRLFSGAASYPCAIGRSGCRPAETKIEGDGATPLGSWPLKRVFYRADRIDRPHTLLTTIALSENDGWCDAPDDERYNRHVQLPYPASHERLWRPEHVYDIIVELGHNDDPVVPGRGSAVFLHVAKPDFSPTEGCVALQIDDLRIFLRSAAAENNRLDIRAG